MRNLGSKVGLAITLAACLSLTAWSEVKVVLNASKIVKTDGNEQKQPADKAKPGDVIEYVAEYKNTDKRPASNVKATLPVPKGMEYLPDSVNPTPAMASTDDQHYAAIPLKRSVKGPDGKLVEQLVPYSEYRSLQWDLGNLGAGETKTVKARMKVRTQ